MTKFEALYRCVRPFDHTLYQRVFRMLSNAERTAGRRLRILDVGGRRSNYTIGLRSHVWITDIPPAGEAQTSLDLGATEEIQRKVAGRRSNVEKYLLDDMTETRLAESSFDVVVAVEVLEHVEQDEAFVRNVARVLKPDGVFIMTTPNGDFLPIPYADHKRHYQRQQLADLLSRHFPAVEVDYVVNAGHLIRIGVQPLSIRTPVRSALSPPALFLNHWVESIGLGGKGPDRKRHLIAVARRAQPSDRA